MDLIAESFIDEDQTYYHGTNKEFDQFLPSERGFFGPGVYGSAIESVARQYGTIIIPFTARGRVFQAFSTYRGTLRNNPGEEESILACLMPDERDSVLDWKSWYKDDSMAFWEAMKRKLGASRAAAVFKAAGYVGIEGIGDGHEINIYDPADVKIISGVT